MLSVFECICIKSISNEKLCHFVNDHEETNVGKNKYHFSRVIGYEELTVKI